MDYLDEDEMDISWLTQSNSASNVDTINLENSGGNGLNPRILYDNVEIEDISDIEESNYIDVESVDVPSQTLNDVKHHMEDQLHSTHGPKRQKVEEGEHEKKKGQPKRIFKEPTKEADMATAEKKRYSDESQKKIRWALKLYSEWRDNRIKVASCDVRIYHVNLKYLYSFTQSDLCFSLSRFIREIKKLDGCEYPPNTLREIIIMIQMYLNQNAITWKLFDDPEFNSLKNVVDNTMKERTAEGLGVRKTCDVITLEHEDQLFSKGILGEDSPLQLSRTIVYMLGLHCALRGGAEHDRLRRPGHNPQIQITKDSKGSEVLKYVEDPLQKTNQGGIKCKQHNKVVYVYPSSNAQRCPVRLYKKYIGLLPENKKCKKLYLRCRAKPTPAVWYCDQPLGKNKVGTVVKEMCKEAGLEGRFTNHSLRATSATRMYQSNIPEQVIKEIAGHRSNSVRIYKRTSEDFKQEASATIAGKNNIPSIESVPEKLEKPVELDMYVEKDNSQLQCNDACKTSEDLKQEKAEGLSMPQMVANLAKSRLEIAKKRLVNKYSQKKKVPTRSKSMQKKNIVVDLNLNINVNQ